MPVRPWTLLGGGLVVSASTALVPILAGGAPLDQDAWSLHPRVLGDVKITSAALFDLGVFFIVIGVVLMIFEGLGEGPNDQLDAEAATSASHDRREDS